MGTKIRTRGDFDKRSFGGVLSASYDILNGTCVPQRPPRQRLRYLNAQLSPSWDAHRARAKS